MKPNATLSFYDSLTPEQRANQNIRVVSEMATSHAIALVSRKVPISVTLEVDGWRVTIDVSQLDAE